MKSGKLKRSVARIILVLGLLSVSGIVASCAGTGNESPAQSVQVIRNVTVIDGTDGPAQKGVTVVIKDGLIDAVSVDAIYDTNAEVIDGTGMTVVPGLIDMHGHLFGRGATETLPQHETYAKLFLAGGVTTIFSPGSRDPDAVIEFRRRIEAGESVGPRIHLAGRYVDKGQSVVSWIDGFGDVAEAESYFEPYLGELSALKLYTGVDRDFGKKAVEYAHRNGLFVTGHIGAMTVQEAVEIGIDGLEHGLYTITELVGEAGYPAIICATANADVDSPEATRLIRMLRDNDVYITPTTVVHLAMKGDISVYPYDWKRFLSEQGRAVWSDLKGTVLSLPSEVRDCFDRAFENHLRFVARAHRAGVRVLAGTDPIPPMVSPGLSLHLEINYLMAAGMSIEEAINAASLSAAEVLGVDRRFGSIEKGKVADLVVIDGNVLEDPMSLFNTYRVYKSGVAFDPSELRQSAEGGIR